PHTAAPNADPAIASSEIGVSKTRSSPWRSYRPGVVAKTPPGLATSSPKKITRSSRASSSSSASRTACRNSSVGMVRGLLARSEGESQRLLERRADVGQERGGVGAVEDAVVAGERERHAMAGDDGAVAHDRALLQRADGEDRRLRRVQHG